MWTMKLQIVENGPIEIQFCQLLNKHKHNLVTHWQHADVWRINGLEEQKFDEICKNKKKITTSSLLLKLW